MAILDIHEATNGDEYDYGMPKNLIWDMQFSLEQSGATGTSCWYLGSMD